MLSGDLFGTRRESGPAGSLVYPSRPLTRPRTPTVEDRPGRTPAPDPPSARPRTPTVPTWTDPPYPRPDLDGPPIPAARPTVLYSRRSLDYGSPSQPAPVGPDPNLYSRPTDPPHPPPSGPLGGPDL